MGEGEASPPLSKRNFFNIDVLSPQCAGNFPCVKNPSCAPESLIPPCLKKMLKE